MTDQTIASDDPDEMAERLAATAREVGADALNLRVQLPGMSPEQVREQIEQIGATVVASLREIWPPPAAGARHAARNYRIGVQPLERWFPPSTSRVIPVICRASSDSRKHTAPAMSSASVSRPRGRFEPAAAPPSAPRWVGSPWSAPARGSRRSPGPLAGQIGGDRPRHGVERGLRRRVGDHGRRRLVRRAARDGDDRPAVLPEALGPCAARINATVGQVLSRIVSRSCASLMVSNDSGWGAPPTRADDQVDAAERRRRPGR